ncbi:MAG: hypothetical protein LBE36_11800 [Flavobacteriaceae bacterium]|nr:hypothetical protein [Flavobacteriaceae bacterium]
MFSQENEVEKNYTKKEIYIPMRDGVKLFTSILKIFNNSTVEVWVLK